MKRTDISLQQLVGKGYAEFWNTKKTYVVCKGSRGSKKSKTTALWHIYHMMKYPESNTLVVRKVERTLRDSTFSDMQWAIRQLKVENLWQCTTSPLEITYKPTGQKILFRGMDDPLKLASVSVPKGVLNFLWIEEAYEIMKESDFDMLDESIRGVLPEGYWKRVTITLNPWNEHHWIKKRFFDNPDDDTLAMTTTYLCNEWLSPQDIKLFENMKQRNPRRYRVAGLGDWGIVEGLVYENWKEQNFTLEQVKNCVTVAGLDFGYTNHESAFFIGFLDKENHRLYVWDEMYKKGLSNKAIYEEITSMGYGKEHIIGDSAEPKSIDELRKYGLRIDGAGKGKKGFSKNEGVQWIQDLEIIVHPRCVNFITEISNYTWAVDKFGNKTNETIKEFDHLMDAMRYSLEKYIIGNKWLY